MPVVNSVVDRLRDIKKRFDVGVDTVQRRYHNVHNLWSVGSPFHVQEFYKYIKVYKQCPDNDLLFMNMTAQLARAAMLPTNRMFKQMLKFERHINDLLVKEGLFDVFGSRGIEILSCNNTHFIRRYTSYKRRSEVKKNQKELKTARKNAKVLAAVREARLKAKTAELLLQQKTAVQKIEPVLEVVVEKEKEKEEEEKKEEEEEKKERKEVEDDVETKLNEVVEQLIQATPVEHEGGENDSEVESTSGSEDVEEEEEEKEEEEEEDEDSEDEDVEKIEEKDVDALEYEML